MRRRRGMTLLELLVATGLLVVVGTLAYGAFTGLHDVQRDLETRQRMIASCRNQVLAASRQLEGLVAAPRVLPKEGESGLAFSGGKDKMEFTVAVLGADAHLETRRLEPGREGALVFFAYHRRGAPLDAWEETWQNRPELPDLVRVTAIAGDPAQRAGAIQLSTLVPVRCAP